MAVEKKDRNESHSPIVVIRRNMYSRMRTVTRKRNRHDEFLILHVSTREFARSRRSQFCVNPLHQAAFRTKAASRRYVRLPNTQQTGITSYGCNDVIRMNVII